MMQLSSTLATPTDIGNILINGISNANGFCCAPELLNLMGVITDNYQELLGTLASPITFAS